MRDTQKCTIGAGRGMGILSKHGKHTFVTDARLLLWGDALAVFLPNTKVATEADGQYVPKASEIIDAVKKTMGQGNYNCTQLDTIPIKVSKTEMRLAYYNGELQGLDLGEVKVGDTKKSHDKIILNVDYINLFVALGATEFCWNSRKEWIWGTIHGGVKFLLMPVNPN